MGYFEATVLFITGLIAFAVLLPVGTALLPDIRDSMGNTVVIMISAMFVIIIVLAFMLYIKQSQGPDMYIGQGPGEGY